MAKSYKLFKVLGNQKRLNIIKLLLRKEKLSVEVISKKIRSSYKSTSKHLLILESAGLVKRTQDKWWGFYGINRNKMADIRNIITTAKKVV